MKDVSKTPEFSAVVGATFRSKQELWAIGVTADSNYKKRVDYVVLVPGVGFAGPEVVTKEHLPKGFMFRVIGVLKASSLFTSRVVYVVEDVGTGKFKGSVVQVSQTGQVSDRNLGLDEANYERIK